MEMLMTFVLYVSISLCSTYLFYVSCTGNSRKKQMAALFFAIFIPAFFAGVRGENVGSDTGMYIQEYYYPHSFLFGSGFKRTFELGFRLVRDLLLEAKMPHQVFFFVLQATTLFFLFLAAKNESKEIDIRVTMFVYMFDAYYQSYNMMRQALAVAIVIYAFTLIAQEKNIKGIVFIILAGLFHKSAWVCLAIIPIKFFLKRKHGKIYVLIGSILTGLVLLDNRLLRKIAILFFGDKAIWYTTTSDTGSRLWVYFLKLIPLILVMILCIKNSSEKNRRFVFYSGLVLMGYILGAYGNFVATDAQRMTLYISRLDAIVLGYAITHNLYFSEKRYINPKQMKYMIYAYYIVMFTYNYFYVGVSRIVPYTYSFSKG